MHKEMRVGIGPSVLLAYMCISHNLGKTLTLPIWRVADHCAIEHTISPQMKAQPQIW